MFFRRNVNVMVIGSTGMLGACLLNMLERLSLVRDSGIGKVWGVSREDL